MLHVTEILNDDKFRSPRVTGPSPAQKGTASLTPKMQETVL
jgi:hypothetical protein